MRQVPRDQILCNSRPRFVSYDILARQHNARFPPHPGMIPLVCVHDGVGSNAIVLASNLIFIFDNWVENRRAR